MNQTELEQQFIDLVGRHKQIVYKVCFMYGGNDDDINDLYQEVMLNLWKAFPRFRGGSKPSTWVYRIAMNTCISQLRWKQARPRTVAFTMPMAELMADSREHDNLKELYSLISRLSVLERALILLWLDDKSYDEISEILGITVSNVGVRINRIKAKLKKMSNK